MIVSLPICIGSLPSDEVASLILFLTNISNGKQEDIPAFHRFTFTLYTCSSMCNKFGYVCLSACTEIYSQGDMSEGSWITVFFLIRAPGALARSHLALWGESWDSELSNDGFRWKIGQLIMKLRVFWIHVFMIELASSKLWGRPY